jgi:aspartate/methionine/tyrosine aminotransferase
MTVTIVSDMSHKVVSEYLAWVKTRKPGRYNLASSGVAPYPISKLTTRIEDMEHNGLSLYGYPPLQAAIAAHCGVPENSVVASCGTSMANFLALAALIEPGDEVLIEEPVYEPILAAAQYFRGSVRRLKRRNDADFQLPDVEEYITNRTKLIVITNLYNPSSALVPEATLRHYGEVAASFGARILVDEVYLECMYGRMSTAFHYGPQFVVTSSLTKAYGVGGLRCGWILAEPALAARIWSLKDLIDPSAPHPAESLSVLAFKKLDQLAERAGMLLERNRALVREFFRNCDGLECSVPDFGTCIFPRFKGGDTQRLFDILHDRHDTDIVPGRFFEMPDHFRLGIGMETETLSIGLEHLSRVLCEL